MKIKKDEFKDFIIYDVLEKQKPMKQKQKEVKSHVLAAPFILDQASVSYRAPSGYYESFGQTDLKFTDQKDFSPSPPPQIFEKKNHYYR